MQRRELPADWDRDLPSFLPDPKGVAGRDASGQVLNALAKNIPWLLGGSADLAPSNRTTLKFPGAGDFDVGTGGGRNLHFGIREHAMAAIANGLCLSKLRPFAATFLIFSDYARAAIRLSAIMELPTIFVFTHDAMGDGEDGPTHQPVEHLAALRAIPNLLVFRPADTVETAECWAKALQERHHPSIIALTRQALPALRLKYGKENLSALGGYILARAEGRRQATIFASGSEVSVAMAARDLLQKDGIGAAVVSMPCWELFDAQPEPYRRKVLGRARGRVAVEAASPFGWERYVGTADAVVGMRSFGASAPAADLFKHFGITAEAVAGLVKQRL
jgi:transketolase